MSKLTRLGENSPLWRRVQRHAQMSAIFAPPVVTAVPPLLAFAPAQPATAAAELEPWDAAETAVSASQPANPMPLPIQPSIQRTANSETAVASPQPAQPTKPADSKNIEDEPNWRRLQTIMQRHRQKQAAEQDGLEDPTSVETAQRKQSGSSEATQTVPPMPHESEATANPAQQAEEAAPAMQSVPLDAAWPVRKKSGETPYSSPPAPQPTATPTKFQPAPLPEEEAAQINQNLAQVAPGRQTQSPIETIMPSRPRPQPKAPELVQRQPVKKNADAGPKPPKDQGKMNTAVPSQPASSKLIQTEIGPLPADLWETLGEKPPEAPTGEEPTTAMLSGEQPSEAPVAVESVSTTALTETNMPDTLPATLPATIPQQQDVMRLKRSLPESPQAEPADPATETKVMSATAVLPTNTIMAKPFQPKDKAQQAAKSAALNPFTTTSGREASQQKVNITREFAAEAKTAGRETTHQTPKTAVAPTPVKSLAEASAPAAQINRETTVSLQDVKPSQPKDKAQPTAVPPTRSSLNVPSPLSGEATIQRQAAESAASNPSTTTSGREASQQKVNITREFAAEVETAGRETIHQTPKTAVAPTLVKSLAEPSTPAPQIIQAKPIRPSNSAPQTEAAVVPTPPTRQIQTVSSAPAAQISRETAVSSQDDRPQPRVPTKSKIETQPAPAATTIQTHSQPVTASSETVIQRLPDLPATLETEAEAVSHHLTEIMPEAATAVLDEIPSTETEAEQTSREDFDIDALSRQVYQQLKRKLAVEWERGYGR